MFPVGLPTPAAVPAKTAISLYGERSMPVEARNDLSAVRRFAACGGKAARDVRPTKEDMRPHCSKSYVLP